MSATGRPEHRFHDVRHPVDVPGTLPWERAGLAAILVLALALRLVDLDASLWYDEVFSLGHFIRLPWAELVRDFSSLNNHMFYSLQAKLAVALLGESAWVLRLPALVFGLASLLAIWWMAREAAGRVPALATTLLLAVSYHHVWFTQNARGYTGLLFWTTLATVFFVRGLARPGARVFTAYALCVAAAMYTHLSAGFVIAAHGLVYVGAWGLQCVRGGPLQGLRGAAPIAGFLGAGVLVGLLHLPLLAQAIATVGRVSGRAGTSSMAEWQSPLRTAQEILGSVGDLGLLAPVALTAAVVLAILGAILIARWAPVLVAVYVVHIPLSLAVLAALSFRIWPRYFFVDLGFVMLAIVAATFAISQRAGALLLRRFASPAIAELPWRGAVTVMVAASAVLLAKNYEHPKQDFAGAVALIERQRQPGDITTSVGLATDTMRNYFAPTWPVVTTGEDLGRLLASGHPVWLVTAFQSHTEKQRADVMAIVREQFDLIARLPGTLGDGTVRVYRSRP